MNYLRKQRHKQEVETVEIMIRMYCQAHHQNKPLCNSCTELFSYAKIKYDNCLFGDEKPVCSVCTVHCYNPFNRGKIKEVMRFAGPRVYVGRPCERITRNILKRKFSGKMKPVKITTHTKNTL